jgi:hypothetical protein
MQALVLNKCTFAAPSLFTQSNCGPGSTALDTLGYISSSPLRNAVR